MQLEAATVKAVGRIVASSIVQNHLKKLNKSKDAMTPDDCRKLAQNTVSSAALFLTNEEGERFRITMRHLLEENYLHS
ncbi:MAG: hypothetical protein P4M01_09365 [Acidobacteriota bacterium]|nr:hypothetical protein [Acidobacteriota bacterium]